MDHGTAGTGINPELGRKLMDPSSHSEWQAREARRAQIMHRIFMGIAKTGLPSQRMYRLARRKAGSSRIFRSFKRFEFLFLAWRKNPRPETLLRNWNPRGGAKKASAELVRKIEAFAVSKRVTVCEAHRRLGLPVSYQTVFRHCGHRRAISQLAAIRRAQKRLAMREEQLLERIKG